MIGLLVKNEISPADKTEGACECRISGTHVHPLFYRMTIGCVITDLCDR